MAALGQVLAVIGQVAAQGGHGVWWVVGVRGTYRIGTRSPARVTSHHPLSGIADRNGAVTVIPSAARFT